ncbi:MAG: MBOAT family O-acyltransferase, partial [Arenibacter latericius]|nr:MBOAT family O-acyltransferase [Arenibacter latericius]
MTLTEYVKKRNGVPIGSSKSLRNNLYRSLGAKNFSTFWNYWNPIFGYYLGKYIFKPLKRILPVGVALLFTFIFCGMIHDAVTTIFRWKISLFFTIWFSMMGVSVLITRYFNHNFSKQIWV